MANRDKKYDDLINGLAEDLKPVKCLRHPLWRITPWIIGAIIYTACSIYFIGLRHDFATALKNPIFLFEVILMIYIGVTAAISSAYLSVPDMCQKKWLIASNITAIAAFMLWCALQWVTDGMYIPPIDMGHCMGEGAFIAIIPIALLIFMMKQGMTTHPYLMASMNIIAITALGYVTLRCTCAADSLAHATISHLIPYILIGAALGIAARKIYKW